MRGSTTDVAYRTAAIMVAASWVLIPLSLWAPNPQMWNTAGGLFVSLSMLVQFRAEGRMRLAKVSLWTTAISGLCLVVTLLMVVSAHSGDAGTAPARPIARASGSRVIVGPHDHFDPPIPESGATPGQ